MDYQSDSRIVMTLDAGGTNLVFAAMQAGGLVNEPFAFSSRGKDLEHILTSIIKGFEKVRASLAESPCAISFAFPGPAEFGPGIIGDLENLQAFRGGVALGPMLKGHFNLPVFINNDGDLFAFGEARAGLLPWVNKILAQKNSPKRFKNLLGVTLGTGFGAGIVHKGELFRGDNWASGEINRMSNHLNPRFTVEETVSIRGVRNTYARLTGITPEQAPSPKEIYLVAKGRVPGDQKAARESFSELAHVLADALANAATLVDGLIVIGGGLGRAHDLFLDQVVRQMNRPFDRPGQKDVPRLESKVFNLEDPDQLTRFCEGDLRTISIPFSSQTIAYDPLKRLGVGVTRLGTAKAVSLGAYIYALNQLDNN
ncbi:ROK family protein [Dethiosulfatarculus sandiegensis]|uniref:ROK family transcriptional regulator n=1 Tax=Dethiosulfatarculus sandiegensis TaxID=1429043 RepID=A0A0D2J915_9BACT|nr:ROK family protein [Dethiosulfatarculus sandiegensis]KIX12216.1 ROK family transcriptional regulator [Dethiosulfatarculus sandiegensis]